MRGGAPGSGAEHHVRTLEPVTAPETPALPARRRSGGGLDPAPPRGHVAQAACGLDSTHA